MDLKRFDMIQTKIIPYYIINALPNGFYSLL